MDAIRAALTDLSARLSKIEAAQHGAKAVYVGDGRLLTKSDLFDLLYYVEANDRLIVPKFVMNGIFEADVTHFLRRNVAPESVCVDVGANFGYYTCIMARLAHQGRTTGVEADPKVFELARDNVFINWLESRATVENYAVADREGEIELYRRVGRSGNTGILQVSAERLAQLGEPPQQPFTVRCGTLDQAFPGRVDFLKIDVEGAEPLVFRGASKLVASNPDIRIVMEWSPEQLTHGGCDIGEFVEELAAMKLQPSILDYEGTPVKSSWAELKDKPYCNTVLTRRA
jgi:FkbM family methyltransferase